MSLTYFCPYCWHEAKEARGCPNCGADLRNLSGRSYEKELLAVLQHPEPAVPNRAATILGELGLKSAVGCLMDLAKDASDPYVQEAAVEALGRIRDARALRCLDLLSREGAVRVRAAAERALRAIREHHHARKG